ncbi:hydroxymethylbilane synthase [Porphyromonas pogonae]|uniref:hydroxymethylbilane synthase n=1 Tax=Porphyromonas pogonae TaxID=867595 RepID=UPI002E7A473A|nr:hydroxymethylbilane synthase [Porphyromonas pogonae]
MRSKIVLGTRGSKLAMRQTELVREALMQVYPTLDVEIKVISTKGDRDLNMSLRGQLTKGLFTEEIEAELLSGDIDAAIHSLKDLPVECTAGTCIGAYLKRADTSEVWIGHHHLRDLPAGSVVGTSSHRRAFQLLSKYPHLEIRDIRGNVETRIRKFQEGLYDGILMAKAGIDRLGLGGHIREIIAEDTIVPAPGQGAIAVHIRDNDEELKDVLAQINDHTTEREVITERTILSLLGGGCALPFGCRCHYSHGTYHILAFFSDETGQVTHRAEQTIEEGDYLRQINYLVDTLKSNIQG